MRTSERVYHQICWDPRLDPTRFVFGIDVHRDAPSHVRVADFDPHGDIPWHRVLYVLFDGECCWDRSGTDTLHDIAEEGHAIPRALSPAWWDLREPQRFDGASWVHSVDEAEIRETVTVLTWNVLWDRYDADKLNSAARWRLLLQAVLDSGAEVVALQEVTPAVLELVLGHPEVRAHWWVSHGPGHRDIGEYDLLMLGRVGVAEVGFRVLSPHKGAIGVVLSSGLALCTVHLTSDHTPGSEHIRERQLARLKPALDTVEQPWVVMGDFNRFDEEPILDLVDGWTSLKPAEPTFVPADNPLASLCSTTQRAGRLDRILVRGTARVMDIERLGQHPIEACWPSDHMGLRATVTTAADARVWVGEPTVRSALAWLPDALDEGSIQEVRVHRDARAYRRWPPHINILWGFVPEHALEHAHEALGAGAEAEPFDSVLDEVRTFDNREAVHHLAPSDEGPWQALHQHLKRHLPTVGRDLLRPHLTVARGGQPPMLPKVPAAVHRLAILTRRGPDPFAVRGWLHLGTGMVEVLPEPALKVEAAADVGELVEVLQGVAPMEVVGSHRLGVAVAGSDLDLLCPAPLDVPTILDALQPDAHLELTKAGLPGLRLWCGEQVVDLVDCSGDSEAARLTRTAGADADALLASVADVEAFRGLTRFIKTWARAHTLHDAALGGVEGLAWAVLCAEVSGGPLREGVHRFFETMAARHWGEAFTVLTPSEPRRPITERADRSRVEAALWQGWELLDAGRPIAALLHPPCWHRTVQTAVVVRGDSRRAQGAARGRARALMTALGDVVPRILVDGYALGLPAEADLDLAHERAKVWVAGMTGVQIDLQASDEVR